MKCIYFIIDIRELKLIKVFKNSAYIDIFKSREDSIYMYCWRLPIYKGSICWVGENKGISFKSVVIQVLNILINNQSKEHIEWKPNFSDIYKCKNKNY
jgi:hypothetical protein